MSDLPVVGNYLLERTYYEIRKRVFLRSNIIKISSVCFFTQIQHAKQNIGLDMEEEGLLLWRRLDQTQTNAKH